MAELKTKPGTASVAEFLEGVADEARREDALRVLEMMREVTGREPEMWGGTIVGFGRYQYQGKSCAGEWFLTGFSPRKQNLTLYIIPSVERYPELLERLGKHTTGKSCLYLKRLDDADPAVLRELVRRGVADLRATLPGE